MSSPQTLSRALALLRKMFGPQAQFRAGQWQAIEAVVERRGRALVVQRTGALKLLEVEGAVIVEHNGKAARYSRTSRSWHSSNVAEWDASEAALVIEIELSNRGTE